jgi:ABC-type transport system substrate-binding protein
MAPGGTTPAPPPSSSEIPDEVEADRRWTLAYGAGLPTLLHSPNVRGRGWNEATSLVYSRLFHVGIDGRMEPDLVERFLVLDEGLSWQVRLRTGVTWHDGSPFTLADVRATLDSVLDPEGPGDLRLNLPMIKAVEYPGVSTLIIRLNYPVPLLQVPLSEIAILPAGDQSGAGMIGTGPYRYIRHRADGSLEFRAHEAFHLGKPSIPRIILKEIADDQERAKAVATGSIDFAPVKPQHTSAIRRRSNTWIARMVSGAWRGMPLNLRRPALRDRRVRQAIDLALDRGQIVVNAMLGGGKPAYQPVPPASWAFSEALDASYFDPNRAATLLDEAGWFAGTDGLRYRGRDPRVEVAGMDGAGRASAVAASFERAGPAAVSFLRSGEATRAEAAERRPFMADDGEDEPGDESAGPLTLRLIVWKDEAFRVRASQMVRAQLRRVGIKVELEMVDNATYNRLAEEMGDGYDGFIGGWGSLLDPGDNLYKKFHSGGSQNYMGYSNATVDRMLELCRVASDPEDAKELYGRLMAHLRDEAVLLPLAYPDYLFAARTRVAGFREGVADSWYEFSRNAWRWRLEED